MDLKTTKTSRKKVSSSTEFTSHAVAQLKHDYPNSRFSMYDAVNDGPHLAKVNSTRYKELSDLIHETFENCDISEILQVYAPQMYGMYKLRHEEMRLIVGQSVKKIILYHVTTKSRALESLKSGLDWRRTVRAKFGYGVSFSDDADYANFYADNSPNEVTRVIMICSVLVRKKYLIPKADNGNSLNVPPGRADTTVSHNNLVLVKYNDNEFYPMYFVYYQRKPKHMTQSKYFRGNGNRMRSLVGGIRALNLY